MTCMRNLSFTEEEIDQVWQILVAILHLGNVEYKVDEDKGGEVHVTEHCRGAVERASVLLGMAEVSQMLSMLETKVVKYPG